MAPADPVYSIDVQVETTYVEEHSAPAQRRYVFAYTITIHNSGAVGAQLLSRHWIITDAEGRGQEVRGDGVVGHQPHLMPGESFRYTSSAMIETPVGSMRGTYHMVADDGAEFEAPIAPFSLAVPNALH